MAVRHGSAGLILVSGMASLPFVVSDLRPLLPAKLMVRDRYDNLAKIALVTTPILILHGGADPLVRPANAQRLAQAAPGATLLMVPGAGHDLAYTDTAQRAMTEWLMAHPAARLPANTLCGGSRGLKPAEQHPHKQRHGRACRW